jgi:hypothetical protein
MTITYDVLLACASPDDLEERGAITSKEAIGVFRTFPFAAELEARSANPDLTAPTITFTDQSSGEALAIWSETIGKFVIWLPSELAVADDVADTAAVENCIGLFFDGQIYTLAQVITDFAPAKDTDPD